MPDFLSDGAVLVVDAAHRRAEHARGVEHAGRVPDRDRRPLAARASFSTCRISRTDCEIDRLPADSMHHEAVARPLVDHHLAEGADLVEPGVGARVGEEHQAGVELDAYAIGHDGVSVQGLQAVQRVERLAWARGYRGRARRRLRRARNSPRRRRSVRVVGAAASRRAAAPANRSICALARDPLGLERARASRAPGAAALGGMPARRATWTP